MRIRSVSCLLFTSIAVAVALSTAGTAAAADPPQGGRPSTEAMRRDLEELAVTYNVDLAFSYAIPMVVFWGFVSASFATKDDRWGSAAGATVPSLLLAPPVVHWANGGTARGFAALGGNFGSSLLGALFGGFWGASGCEQGDGGFCASSRNGLLIGLAVGQVAWAAIDIFTPAKKPAVVDKASHRMPTVAVIPVSNGGLLGLAGMF